MGYSDKKVLVVEDNEMNMLLATMALNEYDIEPEEATNGQEAVDKYMSNPEGYYDLIMMDILMPVMDGMTATKAIREAGRSDSEGVAIVAMTAESDPGEIAKFTEGGLSDYIEKPMEMEELEKILEKYLG